MTVAQRQGYEAGRLGVPLSANPYRRDHDDDVADCLACETEGDRNAWRRGWLDAEKQADDENVVRQFREPKQPPRSMPCPTTTPEPHDLGEFPMTCYRCHIEADS